MITQVQRMFILEYLADERRNATQAAIRAGYRKVGARAHACKMLKNPEIRNAIEEQLAARVERLEVTGDFVVMGILESIQTAKAAGIGAWQSQAVQRGYEMLGRYLGIFTDRVEISQDAEIMERLIMGRERARGMAGNEEEGEQPKEHKPEEPKPN